MLDEAFQETWESVLEPYASDPGRAFILPQFFSVLQETLAKGAQGTQEVVVALKLGIKGVKFVDEGETLFGPLKLQSRSGRCEWLRSRTGWD